MLHIAVKGKLKSPRALELLESKGVKLWEGKNLN